MDSIMKSVGIVGLEMSPHLIKMDNKKIFINWLNENWNKLIDIVPFSIYKEIKKLYLFEINNEHWIQKLSQSNGVYDVELNAIIYILEKWLYRQAQVHDKDNAFLYRDNLDGRTALMMRYLFNKEDGLFYDYDVAKKERVKVFNPNHQFYLFWINLSNRKDLALSLLEDIKENYVVFMGLRRLGLMNVANRVGEHIGYQIDDYNPLIVTTNCGLTQTRSQEESIKLIKEAGFDAYDLSMMSVSDFFVSDDYLDNAKKLREYSDALGIKCTQTHSIFPLYHHSFGMDETNRRIVYTNRILEISKILGAEYCVVHPINDFDEQKNYDLFQKFLPTARKIDISIATENMWNWDEGHASLAACSNHDNFKALLDLVNDDHFVACVDVGHAEMHGLKTSAPLMIEKLGHYVKCLHLHDNELHYDRHNLSLIEKIDYDLILDALARIDYQGNITFECDGFIYRMPPELHPSCLKMMCQIGEYLKLELLIRRKATCLKK